MMEKFLVLQFGQVVRRLRKQARLSQEDFAQECGLHRTYIGAIERGEKNVTLATAQKIAHALDIRLSVIIALAENESNHDT